MYRTYDPEMYIRINNWVEKDHEAINVFKNIGIPDFYNIACGDLGLDYCPKYWEYDFYEKRFNVYGLTTADLWIIKTQLSKHSVDFMVTINTTRTTSIDEEKDKIRYRELVHKRNKKKGINK